MFCTYSPARDIKAAKFSFFLAGFAMAAWAPLVPYLKERLGIGHLELSQIILLMGAGSIIGMATTSILIKFLGVRKTLGISAVILLLSIVFLVNAQSYYVAAIAIFIYGVTIGCMEVGSNIYGTLLENEYQRVLLPVMHGFYSTGEIVSLSVIAFMLQISFGIELAIIAPVLAVFALFTLFVPYLSNKKTYQKESFALPRGIGNGLHLLLGAEIDDEMRRTDLLLRRSPISGRIAIDGILVFRPVALSALIGRQVLLGPAQNRSSRGFTGERLYAAKNTAVGLISNNRGQGLDHKLLRALGRSEPPLRFYRTCSRSCRVSASCP